MEAKFYIYKNKKYLISDEVPKNGDFVLTENYGVWFFSEVSAPMPYWCNKNNCKKLILIGKVNEENE